MYIEERRLLPLLLPLLYTLPLVRPGDIVSDGEFMDWIFLKVKVERLRVFVSQNTMQNLVEKNFISAWAVLRFFLLATRFEK